MTKTSNPATNPKPVATPLAEQTFFERATVSEAMTPQVLTCPADAPLRLVAAMMSTEHVHCLVVEHGDGHDPAWGILSDVDLVAAGTAALDQRTAGECAASEFVTVAPGESLTRAAQLMVEHDVTHLVVADRATGRPLGVLSTLDVADAIADRVSLR
jgi:CBS domain-containing protein